MFLKLLKMEAQLWAGLYAWFRRRPYGPGDFPYHARSRMGLLMGVLILVTPLELAFIELLIPWPWLRVSALVLALCAVLWVVMIFASLRSMPHRLETHGLRLRYGVLSGGFIPFEQISDAHVFLAKAPRPGDGLQVDRAIAYLAINGETNLVLRLKEPLRLETALGKTPPVGEIHFATDEPKRMIERLVSRLKPAETELSLSAQS